MASQNTKQETSQQGDLLYINKCWVYFECIDIFFGTQHFQILQRDLQIMNLWILFYWTIYNQQLDMLILWVT